MVNPLLLRELIDNGIIARDEAIVIGVALTVAGVTLLDALLGVINRYFSSRIGEGLIYDLRTQVFDHVQRQPLAFFTRAQTGSLVSRLDGDVMGAQTAIVGVLSSVLSNVLSLIVILVTLFYLSWLVSLIGLLLIPLFIFPARLLGRRLQRLSRESMQLNAEMGSTMTERFNVAGAMLSKLYGRPREESELFAAKAFKVREIGVTRDMYGMVFMIAITLLTGLFTAVTYGVGGALVIHGAFQFGTLVAIAQLLARVYGPIGSLSNVQIQVMTALVSFDRVFEVLDLEPLIKEKPGAVTLPARDAAGTAPSIAFERVDGVRGALHEQHRRRPQPPAGEVRSGHRRPLRAREHGHALEPVVGAAGVGGQRGNRVAAVGLAGRGDLMAVQQAGQKIARPRAQRQQPAHDVGHVAGLVHQVRLVRGGPDDAVGAREVHHRDHVPRAGPVPQQVRVRAAALHEPGGEHEQRERPPGGLRSGRARGPAGTRPRSAACAHRAAARPGRRARARQTSSAAGPPGTCRPSRCRPRSGRGRRTERVPSYGWDSPVPPASSPAEAQPPAPCTWPRAPQWPARRRSSCRRPRAWRPVSRLGPALSRSKQTQQSYPTRIVIVATTRGRGVAAAVARDRTASRSMAQGRNRA